MKVVVVRTFQDKLTKSYHHIGKELVIEDESRVADLVDRSLVEVVEEKKTIYPPQMISLFEKEFEKKDVVKALKSIGENANMGMREETLIASIEALSEELTAKLEEVLNAE